MPTTTPTDSPATKARAHPHRPWPPGASVRAMSTRTPRTITSTLTLGSRLLESDVMRSRSAMAYVSTDSGLSMTCRSGDIPEHWRRQGALPVGAPYRRLTKGPSCSLVGATLPQATQRRVLRRPRRVRTLDSRLGSCSCSHARRESIRPAGPRKEMHPATARRASR